MRNLRRNEMLIYYSNLGSSSATDEYGNPIKSYTEPEPFFISVSSNKGEAVGQAFGTELSYDRTMITSDVSCPINEYSRLWIDKATTQPFNYVVKKKAASINCIQYAIKQVEVSNAEVSNANQSGT